MKLIDDNTYTMADVQAAKQSISENVLRQFTKAYESWEMQESRRKLIPPNYEDLGHRMYEVFKTARGYGY